MKRVLFASAALAILACASHAQAGLLFGRRMDCNQRPVTKDIGAAKDRDVERLSAAKIVTPAALDRAPLVASSPLAIDPADLVALRELNLRGAGSTAGLASK